MLLQRGSGCPMRVTGKVISEKAGRTFYQCLFWQGRLKLLVRGQSRIPILPWDPTNSPCCNASQLCAAILDQEKAGPNHKHKNMKARHIKTGTKSQTIAKILTLRINPFPPLFALVSNLSVISHPSNCLWWYMPASKYFLAAFSSLAIQSNPCEQAGQVKHRRPGYI